LLWYSWFGCFILNYTLKIKQP